jgi:hypothetical protein
MADDGSKRLDHIMHVDTHALLITLRELELKLTDHNRHDLIPSWASSIIPRLGKAASLNSY